MKVKLTNFEIEHYMNIIANPMSFRNNVAIKLPAEMDWTLRINLKALKDRYELLASARDDINREFTENGKVEGDIVKKDFVSEYNERMNALFSLVNELEFTRINEDDIKSLDMLSMPERDLLNLMIEENSKTEKESK